MAKDKDTFYVTTAIDYASGDPHIGHAYEKITSDVIARWNRGLGKKVYFLTGTDEHGQKILDAAKNAKKDVKVFVEEKVAKFKKLCKDLEISNDYFVRTTDSDHKKFVQKTLQKSYDAGDIYLDKYSGLYCVGCERYYQESDLDKGDICKTHKTKCERVEEESYFFKLSKYEDKLLKLYKENPEFISPKSKQQEIINRVREGLQDISISRINLKWGVPLPFDKKHVAYVWFDALFNYVSALENQDKKSFWPADVHIIGYDIMWFHTVYWPAFLMSTGYELPKKVFSHGMILDTEGHKMSKSLNNVVDPYDLIKEYGVEELKFYFLAMGAYGDDLNFSHDLFIEKINNDLNNDLGNLISRIHTMITKYFDSVIPTPSGLEKIDEDLIKKLNFFEEFDNYMQALSFNKAIDLLWKSIREVNAYINKVEPWKIKDKVRLATIINILASSAKLFAEFVDCVMPEKSNRILKQLGLKKTNTFVFEHIKSAKVGEKDNVFSKVETKKKETKKREGFEILDLRVAEIIDVKPHPDADKLYIEKISFGKGEEKQIVSGLKEYYKPKDLLGKKVVVVTNLLPTKLRGVLSEGMLLAADDKKNVGVLVADAKPGSVVSLEGVKPNPKTKITFDEFSKIKIESTKKGVFYEDKKLVANKKAVSVDKGVIGVVR
ncbi:methionine--tRNA ligase [Candidatus Woesearchaeota archaeon]|nr:methionine--tRNA ligase [Candidatus Woesearchaeota archaeon]